MRPLTALVVLLALTTGCGGDPAADGRDTTDSRTEAPFERQAQVVALEHATGAGGTASTTLTRVEGREALRRLLAPIGDPELRASVSDDVADVLADDGTPFAAVVSVGCDVPDGATAGPADDDGWTISPDPVDDPLPECYAPVTTIAVVNVLGPAAGEDGGS